MGWRFRRSIKILPGVRINISKKGISSASVGPRGLSTTVGKDGVHQNVGVPGTGVSYRTKITGTPSRAGNGASDRGSFIFAMCLLFFFFLLFVGGIIWIVLSS